MKNLKILLLFVLLVLSVFFYAGLTAAQDAEEKEEKDIIWKNPLPKMLQKMKRRAEETLDKLKSFNFFYDFDDISSQALGVLMEELNEEINNCPSKDVEVLLKKRNLVIKLAGILYEYEKYNFFYQQGEEYINKLKELDWVIHYHDPTVFLKTLSQFYDSRYRFQLDKELNINFDRIVIFSSSNDIEFPNSLVTGIIKYDNTEKEKLREDIVGFYFRGYLNNPESILNSEIFELRWLDSEGKKHIVWHYIMPYPFPILTVVKNSLY